MAHSIRVITVPSSQKWALHRESPTSIHLSYYQAISRLLCFYLVSALYADKTTTFILNCFPKKLFTPCIAWRINKRHYKSARIGKMNHISKFLYLTLKILLSSKTREISLAFVTGKNSISFSNSNRYFWPLFLRFCLYQYWRSICPCFRQWANFRQGTQQSQIPSSSFNSCLSSCT